MPFLVKHQTFEAIDNDCTPIFAFTFPAKVSDLWIRRHQVPMSPAFSMTEYKVIPVLNLYAEFCRGCKRTGKDFSFQHLYYFVCIKSMSLAYYNMYQDESTTTRLNYYCNYIGR